MRISDWSSDVCSSDLAVVLPVESVIRTNSSEVVREAMLAGIGIALRSSWDVAAELKSGALRVVLPDYGGARDAAIFAGYPSRRLMPPAVQHLIRFLHGLLGPAPSLERGRTPPQAALG